MAERKPGAGEEKDYLERLRHSASHIMAQAVTDLFPGTKLAIGPAIEEGFYYDLDVPRPITPEDLGAIEKRMREIIKARVPFVREEVGKEQAKRIFEGQQFKLEMIDELSDEIISAYRQGDFVDLCRGPHVDSTGEVKAFKLLSVAGAYWRGDERRPMLQRIYGTAFPTEAELEAHLNKLAEAAKRDHRRLGKDLDMFSVHDEIGPGLILWHPRGARVRTIIEDFWRAEHDKRGYEPVFTPHIASEKIYAISGHLENYAENMYSAMDIDTMPYRVKPMNCPGHILIYKSRRRSYRELPIRYAELGTVYRYERSGVLHGMLRVRGFTQDDSHIFCTPEQLTDEIIGVLDLVDYMMKTFGYTYSAYLATRPEKYLGTEEMWARAIGGLRQALEQRGMSYEEDPGGGVFYGPKIDIKLWDALGREWQGPTVQLDLNLPERFDVNYFGADGAEHRAIMIHRTVLGSMERFIGGLIEHYAGAFPVWLAPTQAKVIPIADRHLDFSKEMGDRLRLAGLRAEVDARAERMALKIREAQLQKIPYMLVVGDQEVNAGAVSVRLRSGENLGAVSVDHFIDMAKKAVEERT
ncbi:MAG: threonine--tRNA ligase [Dehalococcoidia bacterium]|nr:threonine--tRNA ligase [Dehalococcoidia bacterium]